MAIASVLDQTYDDYEIVVVDDGSSDNTRAMIEAIPDPRVRYVHQSNQGPAAARNRGILEARAGLIAFLDADDTYLPDKLSQQAKTLDDQPDAGLVAGGHLFVNDAGQSVAERQPWRSHPQLDLPTWLCSCPITMNSVMVRREWLARAGGFDLGLGSQSEDRDLWLRLSYLGCRMVWTPLAVCTYRIHEGQRVRDGQRQKESMFQLLDKLFSQTDLPPAIKGMRQHVYATAYHSGAFRQYAAGQVDAARQDLATAIELEPGID